MVRALEFRSWTMPIYADMGDGTPLPPPLPASVAITDAAMMAALFLRDTRTLEDEDALCGATLPHWDAFDDYDKDALFNNATIANELLLSADTHDLVDAVASGATRPTLLDAAMIATADGDGNGASYGQQLSTTFVSSTLDSLSAAVAAPFVSSSPRQTPFGPRFSQFSSAKNSPVPLCVNVSDCDPSPSEMARITYLVPQVGCSSKEQPPSVVDDDDLLWPLLSWPSPGGMTTSELFWSSSPIPETNNFLPVSSSTSSSASTSL